MAIICNFTFGTHLFKPGHDIESSRRRCFQRTAAGNPQRGPVRQASGSQTEIGRSDIRRSRLLRQGTAVVIGTQLLGGMGGQRSTAAAQETASGIPEPGDNQVSMRTLKDSGLAVSIYPRLGYDASAGGGVAESTPSGSTSDRLNITFNPETVNIPDVTWRTATFLGLPLPPIFRIRVQPESLEGWIDRGTGEVELNFLASFYFTAPLYKAAPLKVNTRLTTGTVQGARLGGTGVLMDDKGFAKLVGVALVQPTGDKLLDTFLRLPDDTLAIMSSQFTFPMPFKKTDVASDAAPAATDALLQT